MTQKLAYHYSKDHAERAIAFLESLPLVEGEWAGQPMTLFKWFRDDVVKPVFGTLRPDGSRRYRTIYVEIPRKNAKTTYMAGIGLYLLVGEDEARAQVYSGAVDKDQAKYVWSIADEMVKRTPALRRRLTTYKSSLRIVFEETGSFWQVLPGTAPDQLGLNPSGIILDEVREQKDDELWKALTSGVAARRQPLTFAITTAGHETTSKSLCWRLHKRAERSQKYPLKDPSFLGVIYAAQEPEDNQDPTWWTKRRFWKLANPSYPTTPKASALQDECDAALQDPAEENKFKNFHLNIWTAQAVRYIPMVKWHQCPDHAKAEELEGRECYGGLDLASVIDLAAYALVFPPERPKEMESLDDWIGFWDVLVWSFCPEETLHQRVRRDKVEYDQWARDGYLTPTPGNSIDYEYIERVVIETKGKYKVRKIGYDRHEATAMVQRLMAAGFEMEGVGQGWLSMTHPTKFILTLILKGLLRHGPNPVLDWAAENFAVKLDPAGNVKPAKDAASEKIDPIVAIIDALFVAVGAEPKRRESIYQTRGIVSIGEPHEDKRKIDTDADGNGQSGELVATEV